MVLGQGRRWFALLRLQRTQKLVRRLKGIISGGLSGNGIFVGLSLFGSLQRSQLRALAASWRWYPDFWQDVPSILEMGSAFRRFQALRMEFPAIRTQDFVFVLFVQVCMSLVTYPPLGDYKLGHGLVAASLVHHRHWKRWALGPWLCALRAEVTQDPLRLLLLGQVLLLYMQYISGLLQLRQGLEHSQ